MKSATLGTLAYVAVVPVGLVSGRKAPPFSDVLDKFPLAMQSTDGQFTKQLSDIALSINVRFRPALGCQSFPQTLAAVRSGCFAAILPELAVDELPKGTVHTIAAGPLRQLQRDIILVWNPRFVKVRNHAEKVTAKIQTVLRFS
jgi:DNA-binding transcriptional LysR family regulator